MILIRESADVFMASLYSRCSRDKGVSKASSVIPYIPFMGVRISWLMLARNSLLIRLRVRFSYFIIKKGRTDEWMGDFFFCVNFL